MFSVSYDSLLVFQKILGEQGKSSLNRKTQFINPDIFDIERHLTHVKDCVGWVRVKGRKLRNKSCSHEYINLIIFCDATWVSNG